METQVLAHSPDRLSYNLRLRNLLLIRRGFPQSFRQRLGSELADGRTDIQRFDALGPECLVAEERLDDGRLIEMSEICSSEIQGQLTIPARRLAPLVPAPP